MTRCGNKSSSSSSLAASALVLLAVALLHCSQASAHAFQDVVSKLEKYATTPYARSSGLTLKDLTNVVDEWDRMPAEVKAKTLETPQFRLAVHFVVLPTERIRDSFTTNTYAFVAHVTRCEEAYKRFRPAYLGQVIENQNTGTMKMPKLLEVFGKITGHDPRPLVIKDFLLFKTEADAWRARYEDIVNHEDVYANLDEIRNILNYFNGELTAPLFKYVKAQVNPKADVEALRKLFFDKLWEDSHIRFVNGKATR
ncbi:Hypothetical predicted protein, partial [Olea europaea subsp. europaea]